MNVQCEQNMDVIMDTLNWLGKSPRPQCLTKDCRQLREAESRRVDLSKGRAHQLVFQHQMASHENTYTSNIVWTEEVIFGDIYVYTYIHEIMISEKGDPEFVGVWRGI